VAAQVQRVVAISDGKTSTEILRRPVPVQEQAAEGAPAPQEQDRGPVTVEELVIVDAAGRLQIPREFIEKLGLTDRVRITLEGDRVVLRTDQRWARR
jgi:hypothetical protein